MYIATRSRIDVTSVLIAQSVAAACMVLGYGTEAVSLRSPCSLPVNIEQFALFANILDGMYTYSCARGDKLTRNTHYVLCVVPL